MHLSSLAPRFSAFGGGDRSCKSLSSGGGFHRVYYVRVALCVYAFFEIVFSILFAGIFVCWIFRLGRRRSGKLHRSFQRAIAPDPFLREVPLTLS